MDGVARTSEDPMTKPKSKLKTTARSTSRSTSKSRSRTRLAPSSSKTAMRPDTKHARILAMLRMPAGTTIAAIMTDRDEAPKPTEWSRQFEALGLNTE